MNEKKMYREIVSDYGFHSMTRTAIWAARATAGISSVRCFLI